MGLMEFLRKSREADKLAAVLKSSQLDGHERNASTIRRTWRVFRTVAVTRITAIPKRAF
jgi:hypothetical protein